MMTQGDQYTLTTMAFISLIAFFSPSLDPLKYRPGLPLKAFRVTPVLVEILFNFSYPFPMTTPMNLSGMSTWSFLNPPFSLS